jgi:hypothetical protein
VSCAAEWPETGWGRSGHREQHPRLQPQACLQAKSQRNRRTHRAPAHVKRPRHEMIFLKDLKFMSANRFFLTFIILKRKYKYKVLACLCENASKFKKLSQTFQNACCIIH